MKKLWVLLFFIVIWGWAGAQASYAAFLHGPNEENVSYTPYPNVLGPLIDNLPQGFITITIGLGQETYYYSNGVFYQKTVREQKYVMVPPPIGAVVFSIPQGYQFMLIDGASIYENEGVYYRRVLDGYRVIFPPA
jgi:hypothetical protein